ncbi:MULTISPECIES: dipeptidase PepE [Gammaproteobacteria]|uniref:dipeptidase PepE n=1 Tax=Gammaproteobacteria TaxID=1236 RepID=UPI000DCF92FA|nr:MULTISPECIES: dipeptidase PepE [Gammaproteobacteria]RTE87264.1 dipeptidase PepE [Aliidiomarina sp. B3213]TCZ92949.1 dipeptidase PepE [Lysobacter sp. N42]
MKSLLLMSSSRNHAHPTYLEHGLDWLKQHFENKQVVFIPYAGVSMAHQDYTKTVGTAFEKAEIELRGIESFSNPRKAIESAEAVAVGGGNTFMLLNLIYENGIYDPLKDRINNGMPYAGWSAGSNIAGPSIRTTNDMPIIQPRSFSALNAVPFQLNPHYTNATPPGHRGETRSQRIHEFMHVDNHTPIIGIAEGTALHIQNSKMTLLGEDSGVLFENFKETELKPSRDLSYLL